VTGERHHNVEVVGAGPGAAVVAWQSDSSPRGYATYLRSFSFGREVSGDAGDLLGEPAAMARRASVIS